MAIINLRDYYPFYTSDCFMEVSEEVAEMFKEFDRKEAAYRLRTYRHKAYYSLDRDDGLEHEAVFVALSPLISILSCLYPLYTDVCDDLLKVYSDKKALPFFNSDNCDGDNFYYATKERMAEAIGFWHMSYEKGWFVRLSIVDKATSSVIGTIELCLRVSEDNFNNMGILRVDVRSDYEQEDILCDIFSLITPKLEEALGCKGVLTKAPIYAVDRIKAIQEVGFTKSEHLLIGKTGYADDGYWTI